MPEKVQCPCQHGLPYRKPEIAGVYQSEGFIQRHSCGATAVAHASLFLVRLSDAEASHSPVHGGAVDAKPARGLRHIAVAGGQKRAEIGTATVDHGG